MARKYLFILIFTLIVLGILTRQFITLDLIQDNLHTLRVYVDTHYALSVLSFLSIFIIAAVLMLPVSVLLTVLSGALFGPWFGLAYVTIAGALGQALTLMLIRVGLRRVPMPDNETIATLQREIARDGWWYVLSAQLLPFTSLYVLLPAVALSSMSVLQYTISSALGMAPGTLVYTFAGNQLPTITALSDLMTLPILLVFTALALIALLPVFVRRR